MSLRRRGYLMEEKLTVRSMVPDSDLSDRELAQRIKTYTQDNRVAFGLYVKARALKPNMSAKDFYELFDSVGPNAHVQQRTVEFKPTHQSKSNKDLRIMVVSRTPSQVRYILSYGGEGGDPAGLFDNMWKPIR